MHGGGTSIAVCVHCSFITMGLICKGVVALERACAPVCCYWPTIIKEESEEDSTMGPAGALQGIFCIQARLDAGCI